MLPNKINPDASISMDTTWVFWRLVRSCNYDCPWCADRNNVENCVILPARLQRIAWRIFERPATLYDITISGGEPTLHPGLSNIIQYLFSAGRNIRLTLETNGSASPNFYRDLIDIGSPLVFKINVHPSQTNPASVLALIASLREAGAPVVARLFRDNARMEGTNLFANALARLRQAFAFDLEIENGPCKKIRPDRFRKRRNPHYEKLVLMPEVAHGDEKMAHPAPLSGESGSQCWCVAGSNLLVIDPDGRFRGADCDMVVSEGPLWRPNQTLESSRRLVQCQNTTCSAINNVLPRFGNHATASGWLAKKEEREAGLLENLPFVPDPDGKPPNAEQIVRGRLRRMRRPQPEMETPDLPDGSAQTALPGGYTNLLCERIGDIARIFSACADDSSANVFLHSVKALLTGNTDWLEEALPQQAALGAFPDTGSGGKPASSGRFRSLIEMDASSDISAIQGTLRQHKPRLLLCLPLSAESLLDSLLAVLTADPEYRFHFWRIERGGRTICGAVHPDSPKPATARYGTGFAFDLANEARAKLENLPLSRITVDRINPADTAVLVCLDALAEAVGHYRAMLKTKLPIFVIVDQKEIGKNVCRGLPAKAKVVSATAWKRLRQKRFCVYGIKSDHHNAPGSFQRALFACEKLGFPGPLLIDKASTDQLYHRPPKPELVERRFTEICRIYASLADSESREFFLMAIKALQTGDPGYLAWSAYEQYWHPLCQASPGETVVEGGVNDGWTTRQFAEKVGSGGHVYAFEPLRRNFEQSKKYLEKLPQAEMQRCGLWREEADFYIEDNGGGSQMRPDSTSAAEKCHAVSLDAFIGERRCDLFKLDVEGAEMAALEGARRTIGKRAPKLQISLYHHENDYIDIPLWLLRNFPDYELRVGHHCAWHYETMLYASPRKSASILFSVIIYAGSSAPQLAGTLDSILLQDSERLEIIIIDDDRSEEIQQIASKYVKRFPDIVRCSRSQKTRGRGASLNLGLETATGRFVAFMDADERLSDDFLMKAGEVLVDHDADIAALAALARSSAGRDMMWPAAGETYAGAGALTALLEERLGTWQVGGKLYRAEFLRNENIRFPENGGDEDLLFNLRAFYWAKNVAASGRVGARVRLRNIAGSGAALLAGFAETVQDYAEFFEDTGLDINADWARRGLRRLYTRERGRVCAAAANALREGRLADAAPVEKMLQIGSAVEILDCMLADCAELSCGNRQPPVVKSEDRDWRAAASNPRPPIICHPYCDADAKPGRSPLLSVVIPNFNKRNNLEKCLNSVFSQSMKDFEVIVIDDASTDGSCDILCDYADSHANMRLYCMNFNGRQGICRNLGIEKARGEYLTFVDSDDYLEPGFFARGTRAMAESGADVMAFRQRTLGKSDAEIGQMGVPGPRSGEAAFLEYANSTLEAGPVAKIFRTRFVKASGCRFAEYIYHQDHFFTGPLLLKARKVALNDFHAYTVVESANSSTRPKSRRYLHSRSCREFFEYLENMAKERPALRVKMLDHLIWNLKKIFLPTIQAFLTECGETPLSGEDWRSLQKNPLFALGLLAVMSGLAKGAKTAWRILAPETPASRHKHAKVESPLVTVIVPVYNQEERLGRCLDSILGQSLRSMEVIVIDDASTDHTWDVCKTYAARDSRVVILRNEANRRQGYSKNRAMRMAKGEFVAFADSDDYLYDYLQYGAALLRRNPDASFLQCAREEMEDSLIVYREFPNQLTVSGQEFLRMYLEESRSWWNTHGKLYRAKFLLDNDLFFPEYLYEDSIHLLKAYFAATRVIIDPRIAYRQNRTLHPASAMRPVKCTIAHITGIFSYAAWVSRNLGANPGIKNGEYFARKRISWLYAWPMVLEYLAKAEGSAISPLTEKDIANINATPEIFEIFLDRFAGLLAEKGELNKDAGEDYCDEADIPEPAMRYDCLSPSSEQRAPAISIIIPAYNVAPYLEACLKSVFSQNYEDYEIILIEDRSTDNTAEICARQAAQNSKIRFFQAQNHGGQGAARNFGLGKARGRFITFLDSDDSFEPGFLGRAIPAVEASSCDLASFTIGFAYDSRVEWLPKPDKQVSAFEASVEHLDYIWKHCTPWGRIYRSEFLTENNLAFSKYFYEDESFLQEAYACASKHVYMNIKSVRYQQTNPSSVMSNRAAGKKWFLSCVHNIPTITAIFNKYYSQEESSVLRALLANSLFGPNHYFRRDFLGYISYCKKNRLPSPLTRKVIAKLAELPEFMPRVLRAFAAEYQKIAKKEPWKGIS